MTRKTTPFETVTSIAASRADEHFSTSLRSAAYEAIKDQIITCELRPGESIKELSLSAALKIGRTPVHQALERLMHERLVQVISRKGAIVKRVGLDEVLQIAELRSVNEQYCARMAAERASNDDLAALTDVVQRSKKRAALRSVKARMILDREFHSLLARAARNSVLADLLRNLHDRSLRFWFLSRNTPALYARVQREHEAILAAIQARDPDAAALAMKQHIESFRATAARAL